MIPIGNMKRGNVAAVSLMIGFAAVAQAQPAAGRPKLAVMPLTPKRIPAETVEILDDLVANEAARSGAYDVMSAADVNAVLGLEKMKEALGCNDVACAVELGGALGATYLLAGTASSLGGRLIISMRLIDISHQSVTQRAEVEIADDEKLYAEALRRAVGRIFGAKAGSDSTQPISGLTPELRVVTDDEEGRFDVSLLATGDRAFRCDKAVTITQPCILRDVPSGVAKLMIAGDWQRNDLLEVPTETSAQVEIRYRSRLGLWISLGGLAAAGIGTVGGGAIVGFDKEIFEAIATLGAVVGGLSAISSIVTFLLSGYDLSTSALPASNTN